MDISSRNLKILAIFWLRNQKIRVQKMDPRGGERFGKKFSKNAREGRDRKNATEVNPRGGEHFEKKAFKK